MEDEKRISSWNESVREAAEAIIRRTKEKRGSEETPTYGEVMHAMGYFIASLEFELERLPRERKDNRPKLRIVR